MIQENSERLFSFSVFTEEIDLKFYHSDYIFID